MFKNVDEFLVIFCCMPFSSCSRYITDFPLNMSSQGIQNLMYVVKSEFLLPQDFNPV